MVPSGSVPERKCLALYAQKPHLNLLVSSEFFIADNHGLCQQKKLTLIKPSYNSNKANLLTLQTCNSPSFISIAT